MNAFVISIKPSFAKEWMIYPESYPSITEAVKSISKQMGNKTYILESGFVFHCSDGYMYKINGTTLKEDK